jgi:hypothetical protein
VLLHLLTAAFGTLRRIAAMHKFWELSEEQRTCHELVGRISPNANYPKRTLPLS